MNDKLKGILFGAVAAVTYGMNPLFALPLYQAGMTPDSVLFWRYALGIAVLGSLMRAFGKSFALNRREILPLIAAGLLFASSSLFLFLAYRRMDAGIASTILFVYPVMVALIMGTVFHEKITLPVWASIAMALFGIVLLCRTGDGGSLNLPGLTMVLLSALAYAVYLVGVRQFPALRGMAGDKLTFYALLFGLSIFLVRLNFGLELQIMPSWSAWGNVVALAVAPTVVSLFCTARAIKFVGAATTAILGALEPVTAVCFGVTIFHEPLTFRLVLGMLLILAAVSLIIAEKPAMRKLSRVYAVLRRR